MKKFFVSTCFIFGFIINAFYQRNLVTANKVTQATIPSSLKELSALAGNSQPVGDEEEGIGAETDNDNLIQSTKPTTTPKPVVSPKPVVNPASTAVLPSSGTSSSAPTASQPTATPAPVPQGKYKNGTYTGSQADASYGIIQVQAIITNGKISDVKFLSYPNDRQHSIQVSNYAMPILKREAIAVQSENVDTVSGASYTSAAFIESLGIALAKAM